MKLQKGFIMNNENKLQDLFDTAEELMEKETQLFYILEDKAVKSKSHKSYYLVVYLAKVLKLSKLFLEKYKKNKLGNRKQNKTIEQMLKEDFALDEITHSRMDASFAYIEDTVVILEDFLNKFFPEYLKDEGKINLIQDKAKISAAKFIESQNKIKKEKKCTMH